MSKAEKHCKLQYFRAWQGAKKWKKIATKCPKWTSETHLEILAWSKMSQNYLTCHFYAFSSSDIKKTSKNYENTTSIWTRCQNFVSVRNRFWPPPPAKADIATAILTNVHWAFSVADCPPISTPSPPKRCGRIYMIPFLAGILSKKRHTWIQIQMSDFPLPWWVAEG